MRKYRVWDKTRRVFLNSFLVDIVNGISNEDSHNFIIQSSYGVLDINGKEIFQGDYVEHDVKQHYTPWEYEELRKNGLKPKINVFLDSNYQLYFENPKVVGNIFENPELYKETFTYGGFIRRQKE